MANKYMQCPKCNYIRTETDANPEWQCPACKIAYAKFVSRVNETVYRYIPNKIPSKERLTNIIFSLFLFMYGSYGIFINDIYIPGKRSKGVHLHDEPALFMYGAIICACIVMISVVIDHYDERDNEHKYQAIGRLFKFTGWSLFILSLAYSIWTR